MDSLPKFQKYNSIENITRKRFIEQAIIERLHDCTFVVQEKIHGSNFGIYITDTNINYASRNQFIPPDDIFYNYKNVIKKYEINLKLLFQKIQISNKKNIIVIVYGELYGGKYLHKDVEQIPNSIVIQKEVQYCPHNDFIAFDIKVDDNYLSVVESNLLFEETNIPYCETLFTGTLQECLQYSNKFESTIYKKHNLPPIENNICEGVVIKPLEVKFLAKGNRFILKNKNERFAENNVKSRSKTKELSNRARDKLDNLLSYITQNRLNNVMSKMVDSEKNKWNIMQAMYRDIEEESQKEESNINFKMLEKYEQKRINNIVYGAISNLL